MSRERSTIWRMTIIDRYVLHTFVSAVVIFLVAFLALLIVIDFSTRLPRFLALGSVSFFPFVAKYYLCRIPMFATYILPMLTLFAAMFTMIKLQKTNEVLPIVASGQSMRRLTFPFVVASVAAALLTAAVDEFALPPLMQVIGDTDEILLTEEVSYGRVVYDGRNHIWVGSYDHVRKQMNNVVVSRFSDGLKHELVVNAARCVWNADLERWVLYDGTMQPYDAEGRAILIQEPGEAPQKRLDPIPEGGFALQSAIIPEDLRRKFSITGLFYSLRELSRRLVRHPDDARLRLLWHAKFATPLSSVIILLLGLPFVVSTRGRGFFRGLTLCMIVTAAYYVAFLGSIEMGKVGKLPADLAAWMAPALFGVPGLLSYLRMRS